MNSAQKFYDKKSVSDQLKGLPRRELKFLPISVGLSESEFEVVLAQRAVVNDKALI